MTNNWTEEEDDVLFKHKNKPINDIMEYLPKRNYQGVRRRMQRLGFNGNNIEIFKPRFTPRHLLKNRNRWDELYEAAYAFQKAIRKFNVTDTRPHIQIDSDKPVGITFLADIHIGSIDTPLDEVRDRLDILKKYNHMLYPAGCGDKVDNFKPTSHAEGMFETLFPPKIQKAMIEEMYDGLNLLWLIQGCHDDWSYQSDNFDLTEYLADKFDCPNMGFGGLATIHLGDQMYRVAVRHKYKYQSSSNPLHTCMQLVRYEEKTADIAVVAHNHIASIMLNEESDQARVYVRPGSMKGADRYTRSLGFRDITRKMPTVVIFPDTKRMVPFIDLFDAIDFLTPYYE